MSSNFRIIDKDGEWVINRSQFSLPFTRGEEPTVETLRIESGEPTKVRLNVYLEAQPLLERCADPITGEEPIPGVIVPSENTLVPIDENGDPDPSKAPGVVGTTAETSVTGNAPTGQKKK